MTPFHLTYLLLLAALLSGCAAVPNASNTPVATAPTPTLAPADPALEQQTFTVQRGPIERVLDVTGRVTPVDLVRLFFAESGRVAELRVARGDTVQTGDILATLGQEEAVAALQQAELAVISAERDLLAAQGEQAIRAEQARLRLTAARETLQRLLAGPTPTTQERQQAQDAVTDAERALDETRRTAATTKADAETTLADAVDAVVAAQQVYSDAYWAAQQAGDGPNGQFAAEALQAAGRELQAAERNRERAQRALDDARRAEVAQVQAAEDALARAQRTLDQLAVVTPSSAELAAARQAVAEAELDVRAANQTSFAREQNALDAARLSREQAQRAVAAGQIVAPQDGEILALAIRPGDTVEAFAPAIELANPGALEIAAELTVEQLRLLVEGQPAEVLLLARPDLPLPALIRRLPSSGSGAVQGEDRTTRFQITDVRGLTLEANAVAQVRVVLERKLDALLLPPEAVRTFEGRQFVVVRTGEGAGIREQRVAVRLGITTDTAVEVLSGVSEGDMVVGP
jgi:multidrug efflux pump subunit AcrA (membrane-fusion protein)